MRYLGIFIFIFIFYLFLILEKRTVREGKRHSHGFLKFFTPPFISGKILDSDKWLAGRMTSGHVLCYFAMNRSKFGSVKWLKQFTSGKFTRVLGFGALGNQQNVCLCVCVYVFRFREFSFEVSANYSFLLFLLRSSGVFKRFF